MSADQADQQASISQPSEKKYGHLTTLLKQTSAYSKFIADKLRQQELQYVNGDKVSSDKNEKQIFAQPRLITGGSLRHFQLEGVEWLVNLYENGLNGILADEMGLGKTVQCISFIAFLWERQVQGPFLIVGPLSTLPGWQAEFQKFAPSIPTIIYHGQRDERRRAFRTTLKQKPLPVMITSYEMIMKDQAEFSKVLFKYLVIDEGHRIKNIDCKLIRDLQKLSTANRLLLTGTPLQNNLSELWALLHFLLPDIFNDLASFEAWFDPIEANAEHIFDDCKRTHLISTLHEILRPFLLRRLKQDVERNIPEKQEFIVRCRMTQAQRQLYEACQQGRLREHVKDWKGFRLQNQMMQLRKICNHPGLFNVEGESGKMNVLMQLVAFYLENNHCILIFSQMTRMLDIIQEHLDQRQHGYLRIDGSTPDPYRQSAVRTFQSSGDGNRIFLLTTRAAGLGLNLTRADTVILYDADWNPQVDKQAAARVHRIGQSRPVQVIRLMCAQSVEDGRMAHAAQSKMLMEQAVIHRKRFKGRKEYLEPVNACQDLPVMRPSALKSDGGFLLSDHELSVLNDRLSPFPGNTDMLIADGCTQESLLDFARYTAQS